MIKYIWQLPQNLIGLLFKMITGAKLYQKTDTYSVYTVKNRIGVTLGKYIFLYEKDKHMEDSVLHESGHVRQSEILGPLYLFVIGIPSGIHCMLHDTICGRHANYYDFFTEKWADKLAGRKQA